VMAELELNFLMARAMEARDAAGAKVCMGCWIGQHTGCRGGRITNEPGGTYRTFHKKVARCECEEGGDTAHSQRKPRSPGRAEGGRGVSAVMGRLRWSLGVKRRPKPLAGWVRLLWHDFVVHALLNRGGERCQDCGHDYGGWLVGDDLWLLAMPSLGGLLCPACFVLRLGP
jgi:hypothetical protein